MSYATAADGSRIGEGHLMTTRWTSIARRWAAVNRTAANRTLGLLCGFCIAIVRISSKDVIMWQRPRWLLAIGWTLAMAGAARAAEPELLWPTEWTAFGPAPRPGHMSVYGAPDRQDLLPGDELKTIPEELTIGGQTFRAQRLSAANGLLDLRQNMGGAGRGKHAYLMASITAASDMTVQIGAGADWWMQWWVDGQPVYDTLDNGQNGNGSTPITGRDHVFDVTLTKGEHVLAVAVYSAAYAFALAVTSPQEMQAPIHWAFGRSWRRGGGNSIPPGSYDPAILALPGPTSSGR